MFLFIRSHQVAACVTSKWVVTKNSSRHILWCRHTAPAQFPHDIDAVAQKSEPFLGMSHLRLCVRATWVAGKIDTDYKNSMTYLQSKTTSSSFAYKNWKLGTITVVSCNDKRHRHMNMKSILIHIKVSDNFSWKMYYNNVQLIYA